MQKKAAQGERETEPQRETEAYQCCVSRKSGRSLLFVGNVPVFVIGVLLN